MSRRKPTPAMAAALETTLPVAEGRAPVLDLVGALALEAASKAAGIETPIAAVSAIERAEAGEIEAARAELIARAEAARLVAAAPTDNPPDPASPEPPANPEPQE